MSDVTTKDTPASAPAPAPTTTTTTAPSKPKTKSSKPRRARQRRRAAADNDLSGDEAGVQSDSSLTSQSDNGGSDTEPEEAPAPAPAPAAAPAKKKKEKKSVFDDVSSITPTAWANDQGDDVAPISFEDFNARKEPSAAASAARGGGLSIRGRGAKAGKTAPAPTEERPKKEFTPEQTAKYEAKKAKRKEKERAKRAEAKEEKEKLKSKSAAPAVNGESSAPAAPAPSTGTAQPSAKPAKAKGKKKPEITAEAVSTPITDLAASTSALTLDDSVPAASEKDGEKLPQNTITDAEAAQAESSTAPASQPQRPPRQPRASSVNNAQAPHDPKVTPRVGQFWTHDQRLNDGAGPANGGENFRGGPRQMHPFAGRGRGGSPSGPGGLRGGHRGRGRGGFFPFNGRGGFANGPPRPAVELSQEDKEGSSSKLAMDREQELAEAREKAREAGSGSSQPTQETVEATPQPVPPRAPASKWGHEGYEAMSAPEQFRGGLRGRGRGAGAGARGRGGFVPRGVAHLPYAPGNRAATIARAAAAAAAANGTSPSPTPASAVVAETVNPAMDDREKMSTQPTADSLLDPADESVKVKLPGSQASVVPATASPVASTAPAPLPPTTVTATTFVPAPAAETQSAARAEAAPQEAQFPSLHSGSPAPIAAVQAQMYTGGSAAGSSPYPMGSENGSVGSAQFIQHPGQYYASGMTPNGESIPSSAMPVQQRPAFYPQHSQRSYPAQSPGFYPPPSPYSPNPYEQQARASGAPPMGSPQGMYFPGTANGYANGRSSPLNPYMVNPAHSGGYFAPAPSRASAKVAIRAPTQQSAGEASDESVANGAESNGTAQQSAGGGAYYPGHYNPYVQPFVPGQRHEAMYYPGQQYAAYQGYNGEQAYYDASAYGY